MTDHEVLLKRVQYYKQKLQEKIRERQLEMQQDKNTHYMIYNALGFTDKEGYEIDYQQNVGRFLYKYAGTMVEDLVLQCIKDAYPDAKEKVLLKNTIDNSPKKVEIDCLVGKKAYEIKWKDATTDGDHIKKEKKRVKIIKDAGYIPVRVMLFNPERSQAIKIQKKLKELYKEVDGEYYSGEDAWEYLRKITGTDLKRFFENLKE